MEVLDLAIQTLFSEFSEDVLARFKIEQELKQSKTFVKKTIKGKIYWYQQHYHQGQSKQTYFGSDNPTIRKKVDSSKNKRSKKMALVRKLKQNEKRRAAMLKKAGLAFVDKKALKLLENLSRHGLIFQNGVLIGSMAYMTYSALLGVLFHKRTLMTQDIDVVRDASLLDTDQKTLKFDDIFLDGVTAIPTLKAKDWPFSFKDKSGMRIDFLTPLVGKPKKRNLAPGLDDIGSMPLRFLDYLIKDTIHTVFITANGGIPVTVPSPFHFAIHKLITAHYRDSSQLAKSKKDLAQASQLIKACFNENSYELKQALTQAKKMGKKWQKAIHNSTARLDDEAKQIINRLI